MNQAERDAEFIATWKRCGSPKLVAQELGVSLRRVQYRRADVETRNGIKLETFNDQSARGDSIRLKTVFKRHEGRVDLEIDNGCVVVFSDAHYFPGTITTCHRGLLTLIKRLKPAAVICNGDAFDGASISRHPRIGWDRQPTVAEELKCVDQRLSEVVKAARGSQLFWPLGNHDARYETFLAANAPQYEGVQGFSLRDHFPHWKPCWSVWINESCVIKHRWHSGVHATYNNTLKAGTTIVTGHLHRLKVEPFSDYNGTRWGVDTGTLAEPYDLPFIDYTEGSPVNWCSGFAVLTFKGGRLLMPELVRKWDEGIIEFRGELLDADSGRPITAG